MAPFGIAFAVFLTSAVPEGWSRYSEGPAQAAIECAYMSEHFWEVSPDGDIRPRSRGDRQDALPFSIEPREKGMGGSRHAVELDDGWLVGFDIGEYGGGLWWFSPDGRRRRQLIDDNVQGLARHPDGAIAIVGFGHLSIESGRAFNVTKNAAGHHEVSLIADLGTHPKAIVRESSSSILVVDWRGLWRVTPTSATRLVETRLVSPDSIALSPSGEVTVGGRHFVFQFTPMSGGYTEAWLVPETCRSFDIATEKLPDGGTSLWCQCQGRS